MVLLPGRYSYTTLVRVYRTYRNLDGAHTRVHTQINVGKVQSLCLVNARKCTESDQENSCRDYPYSQGSGGISLLAHNCFADWIFHLIRSRKQVHSHEYIFEQSH